MISPQEFQTLSYSNIGPGCELEGQFNFSGDCIISGKLKGDVFVEGAGKLTIEREGVVEGSLYANDVEVFGEVNGNIKTTGTLTARSGSRIAGSINAKNLCIYPGALINIQGKTVS